MSDKFECPHCYTKYTPAVAEFPMMQKCFNKCPRCGEDVTAAPGFLASLGQGFVASQWTPAQDRFEFTLQTGPGDNWPHALCAPRHNEIRFWAPETVFWWLQFEFGVRVGTMSNRELLCVFGWELLFQDGSFVMGKRIEDRLVRVNPIGQPSKGEL